MACLYLGPCSLCKPTGEWQLSMTVARHVERDSERTKEALLAQQISQTNSAIATVNLSSNSLETVVNHVEEMSEMLIQRVGGIDSGLLCPEEGAGGGFSGSYELESLK